MRYQPPSPLQPATGPAGPVLRPARPRRAGLAFGLASILAVAGAGLYTAGVAPGVAASQITQACREAAGRLTKRWQATVADPVSEIAALRDELTQLRTRHAEDLARAEADFRTRVDALVREHQKEVEMLRQERDAMERRWQEEKRALMNLYTP